MTRKDLADILGISLRTLDNWEKEKPELVRLINMGMAIDDQIEETKNHLKRLEEIKEKAGSGKFRIK